MLGVNSPLCFDKRLYTYSLSAKEREKQEYFTNFESREEVFSYNYIYIRLNYHVFLFLQYIDNILDNLLPDDVRHLIAYEDELTQIGLYVFSCIMIMLEIKHLVFLNF